MTKIIKSVRSIESRFDKAMEKFSFHHPYIASLTMIIVLPVFILTAVCVGTAIISLPIALIMGWV